MTAVLEIFLDLTDLKLKLKLIYDSKSLVLFGHPVDSVYARKRVWLRSRISRAVILVHKAFEKPSKVQ